ncbi:unnamed protein product [Rhizophagus irregularis]|nr:unnamed protein product [Rhizophagus irregularis]
MNEVSDITNKKRKRENSSIIWDYYIEEYDADENQLYLVCQVCRNKDIVKRYKWSKGASTTTAQGHLWRDHKIDKDHPEEPVKTDGDIRTAMKYITSKRQLSLEQSLITFIILDCQPLNILRNNAFRDMLHEFEPGFRIPTEEKCKELRNNSYEWTEGNLKELLKSGAESISFTTDLWTSRRNDGYIGVTVSCPKQMGRLKGAQKDRGYPKILEIIQDVRTRWNSSYLAWKRLLELKVAIKWLENTLHLAYIKDDRDDGDYLKLIALTDSEWTLLQDLVDILKPFLDATELLSGSKYTTLSFVYPTMYYLINKFAPTNKESDDDLYDLVYGIIQSEEPETSDLNNEIDDVNRDAFTALTNDEGNETDSEDELLRNSIIEPRLVRTPLRGARGRGRGRGCGRGRGRIGIDNEGSGRRVNADPRFRNRRLIENPVNTTNLLKKVKASIYLSMKEYWNVPKLVGMVAAILDPRLKSLKFVNNDTIKSQTIRKLRELYSAEKLTNPLNDSISNLQQNTASLSSNSIIAALLDDDDNENNINDINEVDAYLNLQFKCLYNPNLGRDI